MAKISWAGLLALLGLFLLWRRVGAAGGFHLVPGGNAFYYRGTPERGAPRDIMADLITNAPLAFQGLRHWDATLGVWHFWDVGTPDYANDLKEVVAGEVYVIIMVAEYTWQTDRWQPYPPV